MSIWQSVQYCTLFYRAMAKNGSQVAACCTKRTDGLILGCFSDDSRSGLVRVLFVHVSESRPGNALHHGAIPGYKLEIRRFRFLVNAYNDKYSIVAQDGNAVVLFRNTRFHALSLRRPRLPPPAHGC